MQTIEEGNAMSACPRCDYSLSQDAKECPACGVVIHKYRARPSPGTVPVARASPPLGEGAQPGITTLVAPQRAQPQVTRSLYYIKPRSWWKAAYFATFVLAVAGTTVFVVYGSDQRTTEEAVLLIADAEVFNRTSLNHAYVKARTKAGSIRFEGIRVSAFAEIERIFQERNRILEESVALRNQALSLMVKRHRSVVDLRASRVKAEEIAAMIQVPQEAANVRTSIAQMFDEQRELIAAEIRLRAEEVMARRLEAERKLQEEQRAVAKVEAERQLYEAKQAAARVEAERQRLAAQYQSGPTQTSEATDCCCKTKVDVGILFTKYEFQYKRLEKHKCTDPGWFAHHSEGWCVPDSYCY